MITLFENFLNESQKNTSLDGGLLIKMIKQHFGDGNDPVNDKIKNIEQTSQYGEMIFIDLFKWKENVMIELKKFIEEYNWYVGRSNVHVMEIYPMYSKIRYDRVPEFLYHATFQENVPMILKYGLKSKSEDMRHKYPPRIYFSHSVESLFPLIRELKRWKSVVGKPNTYSILEVDVRGLNLELFKDQTSAYFGNCYVQGEHISSKRIKVVKENI